MSQHQPWRLHVPEPSGRPGCATDFSYLHLSAAGEIRRPATDTSPVDTMDLAFGLTKTSRLGCQLIMTPELDGLTVALPTATRNMMG